MTAAAAIDSTAAKPSPPERVRPQVAPSPSQQDVDAAQMRVEHTMLRDALVGALLGAILCAAIWTGLVWLALRSSSTARGPMLGMGAGLGVLAGVFLGGWAGTLAGSSKLEHFEHDTRPASPSRSAAT